MPTRESYNDPYSQPGEVNEPQKPSNSEISTNKTALDSKQIKAWWAKIDKSDELRKKDLEETYQDAIDYVKGKQFPEASEGVVINYIASSIWIISNYVYANTPEYKLTGKNPIGEVTSPIAEMALNYYTKEAEVDDENKLCVLDSLLAGEGICLDTMATEFTKGLVPKKETDIPPTDQGEIKQGDEGTSDDSKKKGEQFEYAEYIKKAMPVAFRISPVDFIRDTEAKNFKNCRWCGRWIRRKPVDDVINNKLYRKDALEKLEKQFKGTEDKTLDLAELQVKRWVNGEMETWRLTLCSELKDDYLYYEKEPYDIEGFNYSMLQPKKLGDEQFGLSEFLTYKPIQDLINQVHSKIWEQMEKSGVQTIINKKKLTKKGKTALLRGEGVIEAEWTGSSSEVIGQAETSRIHPDLWRYEGITRDIFRVVSGINEAMRAGTQATGTDTLGELQMIQGGTNVILGGFAKELRKFLIKQGRKRLQLIRQLPVESYIPILGYKDKLSKEFKQHIEGGLFNLSSKYIQGEYDLDLDIETLKAQDEARDRAEIKDMIMTLAQATPMLAGEGKRVKVSKLVEDWLRKYKRFDVGEYIEDLSIRSAEEESLGFLLMGKTGQIIPVNVQEGENLEEHMQKHIQFLQSPLRSDLPSQVYAVAEKHLADTIKAVEEKKKIMKGSVK